jgi:hypothetical protein
MVLGDREFHSVELAKWLTDQKVYLVLRQKKSTKIKLTDCGFTPLKDLGVVRGERRFFEEIQVTQKHQVSHLAMGVYWLRTYRGMGEKEPWYLLTNLPNLPEAIQAYKK